MEVKQPAGERINDTYARSGRMLGGSVNGLHYWTTRVGRVRCYLRRRRQVVEEINLCANVYDCRYKDTTELFFDAVVRHHGLPKVIISDRDPKFTAKFWKSLMTMMGVKLSMTTAHRAQADGQKEHQNLALEDALRCLVSYSGENWVKLLGTIEYAHATSVNASTKLTPFELDTGRKVSNMIAH